MDAKTVVNLLVEIAELEELHTQARQRVQLNARKDQDLRELQAEYEADAAKADAESKQTGHDFRSRDREIREVEARLADRRELLLGVTDNRQHLALTEEISALARRLDHLEDEAIAFLEEEESRVQHAGESRQESLAHGSETEDALHSMERESKDLADRIKNIELDLQRLVSMLPDADARHVQRLRQKLDQSVVFVHNGACCGCFNQLPVQEAINVDRGRTLVRCPSCLRYIVHRPWR